jgi:beta-N-acetylhexosaminidase
MTDKDPRRAPSPPAATQRSARQTRRTFIIGAGIALSGMAIEATTSALRSAFGPLFGENPATAAAAVRRMSASAKTRVATPGIGVEQLAPPGLPARRAQPALVANIEPDLRTRIGQMLLVGFRGTSVDASSSIVADITQQGLGGVVLFDGRNITSPNQLVNLVTTLQSAARSTPLGAQLIVAVDEEGGNVARLSPRNGFPGTYSAATLGQRNDAAFTQAQGTAIAKTLASVGINLNLAPVVDLNLNRYNRAIGGNGRSFSGDAGITSTQAAAFIAGHSAVGVRTAIKHFPGQGSAGGDTHLGVVDVTPNWTDYELVPFSTLIGQGVVDAVMTGHIFNGRLDATYPATLSHATVTGLLREQLGYGGVVISDDLNMGAIRKAYRYEDAVALAVGAGIDVLTIADQVNGSGIVARTIDIIAGLVANGTISEARIDASYERIRALKSRLLGA